MKLFTSTLVLLSLVAASPVMAHEPGHHTRVAQARHEKMQNRVAKHDDKMDAREMTALLNRFDTAWNLRSRAALRTVDMDLEGFIARELAEGRQELRQADLEERRSAAELADARQELARDRAMIAPPPVFRDDVRDLRDARQDLADDQRDTATAAGNQARRRAVASEMRGLLYRLDYGSLLHKRELMVEMIHLQKMEVAQNSAERSEDRREMKEDMREVREDRRQGY